MKNRFNLPKKTFLIGGLSIVVLLFVFLLYFYLKGGRISLPKDEKTALLYIPTGSSFEDVCNDLKQNNYLEDFFLFKFFAKKMKYDTHVRAGMYELERHQNIVSVLRMLRNSRQKPVQLVILKSRTKEEFAGKITAKIEADSTELLELLYDPVFLRKYNLNEETALTLFIQNTYEFFWNTSAIEFFERMAKENKRFWNADRLEKADEINLSPTEVFILASIVDEETNNKAEKPIVASVYLNRLQIGMKLQADPTSRYAARAFAAKRINGHIQMADSPYNTYLHTGLPPGPICIPDINSIDAVLQNQHTNYYYFCAKEDFSGSHNFSNTYSEHLRHRSRYLKEMNKRGW